jgi:cellulose synthase/poly-beta-1,6-N-acetylglucosamine synthase-like glycosyltransferase
MVRENKKISIIIPCKEIDKKTEKCILGCLKLDYNNFEILVLPDKSKDRKFRDRGVRIIETGKIKPGLKRNIGMVKAEGSFYAFIDSDAYPRKDWLRRAMRYFKDKRVGMVGGPNLTPPNASFWEKVSGYTLANFLASGFASIRYKIGKNKYVKELPSCNYIVRKEISGKYSPNLLTAEDSEFCFSVLKKGRKVLYAGDVIVYHHRRDSFFGHIKQMFIYGRDIAKLTKKDFSFDKMYYSVLSLFVIGFFSAFILSFVSPLIKNLFLLFLIFYLLLIFITSVKENLKTAIYVSVTTIATHFAYGFGWLCGILSKDF